MYRRSHSSAAEEAMSLLHSSPTSGPSPDQGQELAIPIPGSYHSISMLHPPKMRSLSKMPRHVFKLKSRPGSKETSSKENPFKTKQGKCTPLEHVSLENDETVLATVSGNSDEQPCSGLLQLSPVSLGYLELSGDHRRPSLSPLSEGFDDTRVVPLAPFPRVSHLPSAFFSDREAAPDFTNPFATPLFPPSGFGGTLLVADSAEHSDDQLSPGPTTSLSAITNVEVDHLTFDPTQVKTQQVKGKALIILGEEVGTFSGTACRKVDSEWLLFAS
ncbi:hypothetical protein IW261DRAFT_1449974 [Armillaria novae-zelandiae]|uniref:Uncharacterized protein n=1 Tax=Armillaria novae-zelandiae TaxID=153914 RepID=A0AA39PNW6_9AGAR|nr:hypothetical protein IW261DRAFT_1449974 [Armillaria novae-zelandiae]